MNDKTDSYNVTNDADQAHDDQWLADQIVELGVGRKRHPDLGDVFQYTIGATRLRLGQFVRDPRVAMALMEKVGPHKIIIYYTGFDWDVEFNEKLSVNISLPRAITEACVEALS